MKLSALFLAALTGALMLADILHASAIRHWNDGQSVIGMNLIRLAATINPFSVPVRLDQIESLYRGYRQTKSVQYLNEIVRIGRGIRQDYPGSVQAWAVYSGAQIFAATHGGAAANMAVIERAIELDPISIPVLERAMFLISAKRGDYQLFKRLGIERSKLTTARLTMRCELCGKHWLEHR